MVLERMKFAEILEAPANERNELALKAKEMLGYTKLAGVVLNPGSLLSALRKLEIQPFVPSTVVEYQRSKAKKGMYSGTKNMLWWLTSVAFFGFLIGPLAAEHTSWVEPHLLCFLAVGCFIYSGIAAFVVFLNWALDGNGGWGSGTRKVTSWQTIGISGYTGNIPDYVLYKAVQIKEEVPQASFHVEYLVESTEKYTKPKPDPFLRVILGTESYYIEVWDEKEYERTI